MIQIKSNERLFIAGKTGSGKSYWIKNLLPSLRRYVFYDPKHQHDDVKAVLVRNTNELINALKKYNHIIFRPLNPRNLAEFNEVCRIIYFTKNIVLVIDECVYYVSSNKIEDWHATLMTTGRTLGVGVWNCTQRPRTVANNILLSESEHVIVFKLKLLTDRQKLAEAYDDLFLKANELGDYKYIYYNERLDIAEIMQPI